MTVGWGYIDEYIYNKIVGIILRSVKRGKLAYHNCVSERFIWLLVVQQGTILKIFLKIN